MNDDVRDTLRQLIVKHGNASVGTPSTFGMMLKMEAPARGPEVPALLVALQEGIPAEILRHRDPATFPEAVQDWAHQLERGHDMSAADARWVVDSWTLALLGSAGVKKVEAAMPAPMPWVAPPNEMTAPVVRSSMARAAVWQLLVLAAVGLASGAAPAVQIWYQVPLAALKSRAAVEAADEDPPDKPGKPVVVGQDDDARRQPGGNDREFGRLIAQRLAERAAARRAGVPLQPNEVSISALDVLNVPEADVLPEIRHLRTVLLGLKERPPMLAFMGVLGGLAGALGGVLGYILGNAVGRANRDWMVSVAKILFAAVATNLAGYGGSWAGFYIGEPAAIFLIPAGACFLSSAFWTFVGRMLPWLLIIVVADPIMRLVFGVGIVEFAFGSFCLPLGGRGVVGR